jgi:hypothetical protein
MEPAGQTRPQPSQLCESHQGSTQVPLQHEPVPPSGNGQLAVWLAEPHVVEGPSLPALSGDCPSRVTESVCASDEASFAVEAASGVSEVDPPHAAVSSSTATTPAPGARAGISLRVVAAHRRGATGAELLSRASGAAIRCAWTRCENSRMTLGENILINLRGERP